MNKTVQDRKVEMEAVKENTNRANPGDEKCRQVNRN